MSGDGGGRKGFEDVSCGGSVGFGAGNVGAAREGEEVAGSGVVGGELEEEGVVSGVLRGRASRDEHDEKDGCSGGG